MRRLRSRWILAFGVCAAIASAFAVTCLSTAASAKPNATDIGVNLGFGSTGTIEVGKTTTVTRTFRISVVVSASSLVPETVRLSTQLGDGLRWGSDAGEGCAGTSPVICTGRTSASTGGNYAFWSWLVSADRAGSFEITANVEGTDSDPDSANNKAAFRFDVVSPSGGGGGGGGSAKATAGSVKLSPAKPKAGSTVVASVRVTKGGSALRPTGVTCAASVGGVKAKGGPKAASGVASCLFKTPKGAKGKSLAGSVSFRASGSAFTKRFAVKLR